MLLCYTSRIDKTNACRAFLTRQAFVLFMGSIRYFASSSSASTSICASAAALAAERMVTTASQTVMFFMPSSSARISFAAVGPGAVLHQANGAALEVLGLEVGQQILHRREEEAIVGGAGQHDPAAAEASVTA